MDLIPCPRCNGRKVHEIHPTLPCHDCEGSGTIPDRRKSAAKAEAEAFNKARDAWAGGDRDYWVGNERRHAADAILDAYFSREAK